MCQERDGDAKQNELLDEMIGNVGELTNPAKAAFENLQQQQTAAYDTRDQNGIMITRMAQGGQMVYSGSDGGWQARTYNDTTYNFSDDPAPPTERKEQMEHYPIYVQNSYPNSWPWSESDASGAPVSATQDSAAPWTAQFPLPNTTHFSVKPGSRPFDCSNNNMPSIRGRQLLSTLEQLVRA